MNAKVKTQKDLDYKVLTNLFALFFENPMIKSKKSEDQIQGATLSHWKQALVKKDIVYKL